MGRKGVSKRKAVQTKSKPLSGGPASGIVSSVMAESQTARSTDAGKAAPSTRSGDKPSSKGNKNAKKG